MNGKHAMKKPKQKYKGTRRRLRLLMVVILCFMGWAGITLWDQTVQVNAKLAQLGELEGELADKKQRNEDYRTEIKRLNDDEYIEQIVRKHFQMTRPGDTLYIVPNDSD